MKSKKSNSTDVLEVEAEEIIPEVPLEKVIENTLVKANVTEQVISALKEKYGSLRLKSLEDKESYLEVKEARKEVRKVGIITEKLCKKGREDAVAIQRKWLDKEREILKKIAEVEDPLNDEIEKFDNEVERKEQEEEKKREANYINRQSQLLKYGAQYNNGSFELNHISYEISLIKQADEDMWNDTILPKYRKVYEEIEAVRVEEENKRKAEMELQRKQREEFEAKQAAFKRQQEEFAKQQKALQEQKDEADNKERNRIAEEKRLKEEAEAKLWRSRLDKLNDIGWNGQYAFARWDNEISIFTYDELINLPDDIFNQRAREYINSVAIRNKEAEEKKAAQIEKEKQEAIQLAAQQEREKIQEEQRQAELKKQQEEQRRLQELELAGDKSKYEDLVSYLKKYPKHSMKSNMYKGKVNAISLYIDNL